MNEQQTAGIFRGKLSFEQGFTRIPNAWLRDNRISMKGKGLLTYLLSHEVGYTITLGQIERETADGRHSIRSAVQELIDAGYLEKRRTHDSRGWNAGLAWILSDPHPKSENPTLENPTLENRPTLEENLKEKKTKREEFPQQVEDSFSEFWKFYPRKVEKIDALKAFGKALNSVDASVIIAGAKRLAEDPNLPPKQFIPYPARWLNAGGWDSEPYPERELTAEEKAAQLKAKAERDRQLALAENERLRIESEKARAAATPPPRCEHDRTIVSCRICLRNVGAKQ